MFGGANQKVIGSLLIGFAMVAGTYVLSNFGTPRSTLPAAVTATEAAPRVAIAVTDKDGNGIEDWRDAFTPAEPVVLSDTTGAYKPPTTVTGQLGVNLFQEMIGARTAGPFGKSNDEVIASTVDDLSVEGTDILYNVKDISILESWDNTDIKNYANTMAGILLNAESRSTDSELFILSDIVRRGEHEKMGELITIRDNYQMLRDQSLLVPVPLPFVKQHLDLINTYHAVYNDVRGMTMSLEDPVIALVRLKRYGDDTLGMRLAFENMYQALVPYSSLFEAGDPALVFSTFASGNQSP